MKYRGFIGFLGGAFTGALSVLAASSALVTVTLAVLAAIYCWALDTKNGEVIE